MDLERQDRSSASIDKYSSIEVHSYLPKIWSFIWLCSVLCKPGWKKALLLLVAPVLLLLSSEISYLFTFPHPRAVTPIEFRQKPLSNAGGGIGRGINILIHKDFYFQMRLPISPMLFWFNLCPQKERCKPQGEKCVSQKTSFRWVEKRQLLQSSSFWFCYIVWKS